MASFHGENFRVADFIRLREKTQLEIQPKFERRLAWEVSAQSYLIDTIVRGLPMPKVYVRRIVNPKTGLDAYEVVDGQQRLNAIFQFYDGNLMLRHKHNPKLGDCTYDRLPGPVQRAFLEYKISTDVMEDATDQEVWAMFERLNTYTLTLNRQERLNAKWFGLFKQACYELAAEQKSLDAWDELNAFTHQQIARMREVEVTSDILVAVVHGISDITEIGRAYREFDDRFPEKRKAAAVFRDSLQYVLQLAEAVRQTRFHRQAWFYSLMVAVADAITGIPGGSGPKRLQPCEKVSTRMRQLDTALRSVPPPRELADLHEAMSRGTSHVGSRRVRHTHFFSMLTSR